MRRWTINQYHIRAFRKEKKRKNNKKISLCVRRFRHFPAYGSEWSLGTKKWRNGHNLEVITLGGSPQWFTTRTRDVKYVVDLRHSFEVVFLTNFKQARHLFVKLISFHFISFIYSRSEGGRGKGERCMSQLDKVSAPLHELQSGIKQLQCSTRYI